MATRRRIVFADDTGDPGERQPAFRIRGFVVDRASMADLVEARTLFRHDTKAYGESKGGNVNRKGFRQALEFLATLFDKDRATAAACLITKEHYRGHWLHARDGKPADPHFLRNYLRMGTPCTPMGFRSPITLRGSRTPWRAARPGRKRRLSRVAVCVWPRWCRGARSRWRTAPGVRWGTSPAPAGD